MFDPVSFGEALIDFTPCDVSADGNPLPAWYGRHFGIPANTTVKNAIEKAASQRGITKNKKNLLRKGDLPQKQPEMYQFVILREKYSNRILTRSLSNVNHSLHL